MASCRIIYLSQGPQALYDLIREEMPENTELVTLENGSMEERRSRIKGCRIAITAGFPLGREVVEAADMLELVHHQGVGYHDTVDLDALRDRRLRLALTPEGTTLGVAEHTILLILALYKRLPFADSELRQGRWHVNSLRMESREIAGRTVGYVGMGRIGQAVASRLRAFETKGLYADPHVQLPASQELELGVTRVPLDRLLQEADIVTLHLPLTPATHHLIDARALGLMRRDAVLINTARGPLVEEVALLEALHDGKIAGAGLDVFEIEPVPASSPLLSRPNVVVTPHISAGTRDAMRAKMAAISRNISHFLKGEPLANEVDLRALP